jgi:hypothetical protein
MRAAAAAVLSKNPDDFQQGTVQRMDWPTTGATEMMVK